MTRIPLTVYYSGAYTASAHAFDTTRKAAWVADALGRFESGSKLLEPTWATPDALRRIHAPDYVEAVRTGAPLALAESSGLAWSPGTWDAVCASTGGAVAAALHALRSRTHCASLSSGLHHARRAHGEGFCTFNGLALAAKAVLDAGAHSVLVLDVDAHMGGGTFSLVREWRGVWQVDLAVCPFVDAYAPAENPRATLDIVRSAHAYLETLRRRLTTLSSIDFDLVIYNAGMDAEERCAIGGLPGMTAAILAEREHTVFDWAEAQGVPVAFVLAGGYAGSRLSREDLVRLHLLTFNAAICGSPGAIQAGTPDPVIEASSPTDVGWSTVPNDDARGSTIRSGRGRHRDSAGRGPGCDDDTREASHVA